MMKKYLVMAIGLMVIAYTLQRRALIRAEAERDRYRQNTETLIRDVEKFKTSDGLNAAKVGQLELTVKELKRMKEDDMRLIDELKGRNDLQQYIGTETTTEVPVHAVVHDTVVKTDSIIIPMKCFDWKDSWAEMHGCFMGQEFSGNILIRDSLVVIESVKRKRFLGFLWKTKKVKSREWSVVSKNPYTRIDDVEIVKIKD